MKGLVSRNTHANMKVLPFAVHKLLPKLKFLSIDDDNNNSAAKSGVMTIVLRTFVTAN